MTTTDDLLDMSVDDQKDQLENLEEDQLKELRDREERSTAIDNIDRELSKSRKERGDPMPSQTDDHPQVQDQDVDGDAEKDDSRIEELEAKVDYLIQGCKTTSEEGFENYEN